MNREKAALLVFLLSALMVLSLSYSIILIGGLSSKNVEPTFSRSNSRNARSSQLHDSSHAQQSGKFPPWGNFTFKKTNISANCPVAILPEDPMLVCVDTPAKGIPIQHNASWNIIVRYPGTYYVPLNGYGMARGTNGDSYLSVNKSMYLAPTGGMFSVVVGFRAWAHNITALKSSYLRVVNSTLKTRNELIFTFKVLPNATPGYYPILFEFRDVGNRVLNALLIWVRILPKAVVRITSQPRELSGDGNLHMTVSGTVTYQNGTPVKGGNILITLNRTKKEAGVVIGRGAVLHGRFTVSCSLPPQIPAGKYSVVAHYTGPGIYPSNSDPELIVRRTPHINATAVKNGTKVIVRGTVHYNGVPLNGTVAVGSDGRNAQVISINLTNGTFSTVLNGSMWSVTIKYLGSDFYLPTEKTIKIQEKYTPRFPLRWPSERVGWIFYAFLMPLAGGIAYILISRRKPAPIEPRHREDSTNGNPVQIVLPRRVFLLGEKIKVVISEECEASLDSSPLGKGTEFELMLGEGMHRFEACGKSVDFWVLSPREAVVKLYELHFLDFADSKGIPTDNRTPYEIAKLLIREGIPDNVLDVASVFVIARYSIREVSESDFWRMFSILEGLEVFK